MKTLFYDRKNDCLVTSDRLRPISDTTSGEEAYGYKTNHRTRKFYDKVTTQDELVFLRFVADSYTATLNYNREPITEVGETVPELANPDALPYIAPPELEPSLPITPEELFRVVTQKIKCNVLTIKKCLFNDNLPNNFHEAQNPDHWQVSGRPAEEVATGVIVKRLECLAIAGLYAEAKIQDGRIIHCEINKEQCTA